MTGILMDEVLPEVEAACVAAHGAATAMRHSSPAARRDLLTALADELAEHAGQLIPAIANETQLAVGRVEGEIGRTTGQLRLLAAHVWEAGVFETDEQAVTGGLVQPELRRGAIPLGPVAVFPSSNFPLAFGVPGGDTASALAAGCPVAIKPHPAQPVTSSLLAVIVKRAVAASDLPIDVVTVLEDASVAAGVQLVADSRIQAAGFTGSHSAGRALFDAAAARPQPIPVYAEMGSMNPVLVTQAATAERLDDIAADLAASVENSAGQFCTKPGLIAVAPEHADQFTAAFTEALTGASQPMLTEQMASTFESKSQRTANVASVSTALSPERDGRSVSPAVFRTTLASVSDEAVRWENFGPSTVIVGATQSEWAAMLETLGGQLTLTIHGQPSDIEELGPVMLDLARFAGRLIWNGVPTGVRVSPAQQHGGPYPATTASWSTSVGVHSIDRWLRPVTWQSFPTGLLPGA